MVLLRFEHVYCLVALRTTYIASTYTNVTDADKNIMGIFDSGHSSLLILGLACFVQED